jgi:anti-sigma factor RsiW
MDCSLTQGMLIGYHFACVSDEERSDVEAHLVACTECLRTYLALKAHVDRGASGTPPSSAAEVPSEAARLRLRAAVQARFQPTSARRLARWFATPVPLYQGMAVAAALLLAFALEPALARTFHPAPAVHVAERVDSARSSAESLTIY